MKTAKIDIASTYQLVCSNCKKLYPYSELQTFAACCHQPLIVKYIGVKRLMKDSLKGRENTMWRYHELLPVLDMENKVTLGEGMTPILTLSNLGGFYGFENLLVKDESLNPTGSFKARGLSMAVSKAKELGVKKCVIPTAGNAGGAAAAYCAKAGISCTVVMPRHTPLIFKKECELYGAELVYIDGLIHDCAKKVELLKQKELFFDLSTLKEPYRLEGKKTMGFEIAEQLNWELPDVILYPAGGGTGLIGIWKAFQEMLQLGWIEGSLPKMIAVQSLNCNPLMRYLQDPLYWKETFIPKATIANGLAVPFPFGMQMMQSVLQASGGTVVAINEEDILSGVKEIAKEEGLLMAPEGAALWKALLHIERSGIVSKKSKILLLNTGSGYKYIENFD